MRPATKSAHKSSATLSIRAQPTVCIAVCTRNRNTQLRTALESLGALNLSDDFNTEVLVVNNASSDSTEEVVTKLAADYPELSLRIVHESIVGYAHARNRVLQETEADWIAFFDDDQIADRNWLIELWRVAQKRNADCVGGTVKLDVESGGLVPARFCRNLLGETEPTMPERMYRSGFKPGAGNLLIRRQVIEKVGGFPIDQLGRGEDTRLFERLRAEECVCWFAPKAVIVHVIPAIRNRPAAYRALARECSNSGDLAWRKWGWMLPVVGLTRLFLVLVVHLPQLVWHQLLGSAAQRLDCQCIMILNVYRMLSELRQCGRELTDFPSALAARRD